MGATNEQEEEVLREKSENKQDATDSDDQLPKAPDGGWGWVVVFGSFMVHVIADGIAYSFGIYVEDFVDHFECSRSEVGTLGSLMIGVTWGSGPIASILVNKFGCKFVTVLGTLVAACGFIISIFAPNIYFMYFSFGIVAGFGLGLAYLPAIVAVSFYFEKRRSLATGLAVCGSGLGTFVFAPITQALLEHYSWRGTVLVETGMLLNVILCGLVFRPLIMPAAAGSDEGSMSDTVQGKNGVANGKTALQMNNGDSELSKAVDGSEVPQTVDAKEDDGRRRAQSESWMIHESKPQAVVSPSILKASNSKSTIEEGRRRTQSESWMKEAKARTSTISHPPVLKMMSRKDVFYTQSLDNIPMYKSDPHMYHKSITSVAEVDGSAEKDKSFLCGKDVWETLSELMDFRLMLDLVFVLFAVSNFLTSIGFVVPYIFLPARGVDRGLSEKESAWLISAIGISNTIGRVVFGYIADFKFVNRLMMYNTALVLCGLASIFSFLCFNFMLLLLYSFIFGLLIGVYTCLTPIVLVDLLGLAKLSNAFGLILLMGGIGAVVGPPIAGAIYDKTSDYDNSFFMMGVCILVSGLMLYPIPFLQRLQNKKDTEMDLALGKTPNAKVKLTEEEMSLKKVDA